MCEGTGGSEEGLILQRPISSYSHVQFLRVSMVDIRRMATPRCTGIYETEVDNNDKVTEHNNLHGTCCLMLIG